MMVEVCLIVLVTNNDTVFVAVAVSVVFTVAVTVLNAVPVLVALTV